MEIVDDRLPDGTRFSGPVHRRALARLLADLREAKGLSQPEAAAQLRGISRAKLQYLERGRKPVSDDDIAAMLDVYEAPEDVRRRADEFSGAGKLRGWWDGFRDAEVPPAMKEFAALEWGADDQRVFSASLIHVLVQLDDYGRHALMNYELDWSPEQIDKILALRKRRQEVLAPPHPARYRLVMTEAALLTEVGSPTAMARQLDHIAQIAEASPNVDVRVVRFDKGAFPGTIPRFTILGLGRDDSIVLMEPGVDKATYIDEQDEVFEYSRAFERLVGLALEKDETITLLRSVADDFRAKVARS